MNTVAIVLAAGAGTRMKSEKPKVIHDILGKPLVTWVIDAAREAGASRILTVVGYGREHVEPLLSSDVEVAFQRERRGTADAVLSCKDALDAFDGSVLVLSGDCPLITPAVIKSLVDERERTNAAGVLLTMTPDDPFGYGRIVRNSAGEVERIVEEKDTNEEQRAITECNAGFYCFSALALFEALLQVKDENAQGEFYLTDVVAILRAMGLAVCALHSDDPQVCEGVNSRAQLARATKILQRRINAAHMDSGVTMIDPDQVWIGPDVCIESDVELWPQTFLLGKTHIGSDSIIGPATRLTDTVVGCGCRIDETVALQARIDDCASTGPRAYLRPGTHLCAGSKAGTHVEIKNSTVGQNSKVPHLSYIGDTTIGQDVNVGAGSITCNYDGTRKWPTTIGDGAFIGSDTMMVAPVNVGAHAVVGAGSVITEDVPDGSLALGRARQITKEGWTKREEQR